MLKSATSRLSVARGFINPSLSLTSNSSTTKSFNSLSPIPKHLGLSIRGVRVGGREIPDNKRVEYSLQYIHGIGRTRAHQILCDLNIENKITKDLSQQEINSLRDEVSSYLIDFQLMRSNDLAVKRLKDIQCYRGIRHIQGLPCRGQRTKTNARICRKGMHSALDGKKALR
ncbi:hypothetical protein RHMOL_Rhmol04G0159200 [Rhododendron molle]|uniref:Uncharacterized protein n=3 Tax=Rhododendron molle TaxID=49168 RepID=A0ACC0P3H0_RHOML|nr:hypothetical protein RHMOL_Rhmol04G0159200 [Rhododendron molle]KAI8559268.1 hypothetical protein RHMOL_Rhmol04G0159200 [Rhododendron molle]KAI8559269.1 hypothetical protein RHMOL_Rhmol04G0159200 [Rhododendron molle]